MTQLPQMTQLQAISPPVVHHVKYLERHEVTLALKRRAWSAKRSQTVDIRDATRGSHLFTWRTNMSSPCMYNSYGGLNFFFPMRVTGGVTEINAHDSSRRADMRVSTTLPNPTGKLTAVSALPCGTEARVSLSGPMFGPNGSTLLLNDQAVVVVISSAPAGKIAIEVDEDTYFITVAPGFDISLAVAACLIFVELQG